MKIVLHAPTAGALARARSNLANLKKRQPAPEARIVVNADAVASVLDAPDASADQHTLVCGNTLNKIGRSAASPLVVLHEGAIVALAAMQADGWIYIRA